MTIGFVFPGQGAQTVGMLADISALDSKFKPRIEEASDAVGFDLAGLILDGPEERLNQTEVTQPAVLAVSVALYEVWIGQQGRTPDFMAGHSLGEYSALVASGAMNFRDAVKLVHERGKLMQKAVPLGTGAMAAIIGLDLDEVSALCDKTKGIVSPANINSAEQIVIAGEAEAVDAMTTACKEAGAKRALKLDVSVPSHCELMVSASDEVQLLLEQTEFRLPVIPVIHNVDGEIAEDVAGIVNKLTLQLSNPVRWSLCMQKMIEKGVTDVIECGPGKVLLGLMRRIDRSVNAKAIGEVGSLQEALREFA
ncbi:MAG: [acyl-carrier-protein] S-malonyltransferase [Gammaproteobacteria bacterium]|mgnify:CR=1|jgi:[acyl-carrier-protein] S-malonyltransferase|nr:[acyl-carrier-protein] S-malonyltransferase [Gammaproteobacteria bacterium]|tara:strand:+ start:2448 stop:3374 length:927 start_codon:yes stop_codon:yes gene_type:complete